MPSPIAHVAAGYTIARITGRARPRATAGVSDRVLVGAAVGLSLLPDLDAIPGILAGNFGRYHNNLSHSLFVGLAVAVIVGGIAAASGRFRFGSGFALALVCFELHVVMDYFTVGRGVMAFWPFTAERFSAPIPLFYGLRWSDGWFSQRHLWTLLTEVPLVAAVVFAVTRWVPANEPSGE
jgi:inner membrane protein